MTNISIKVGQVLKLKEENSNKKVRAILEDNALLSAEYDHERTSAWYSFKEIEEQFELPRGSWKPGNAENYYVPYPSTKDMYITESWFDYPSDYDCFERGLCFRTKEEAIAAAEKMLNSLKEGN